MPPLPKSLPLLESLLLKLPLSLPPALSLPLLVLVLPQDLKERARMMALPNTTMPPLIRGRNLSKIDGDEARDPAAAVDRARALQDAALSFDSLDSGVERGIEVERGIGVSGGNRLPSSTFWA